MKLSLIIILLVIPWLATFLGSVFGLAFTPKKRGYQSLLLGFAAGVMLASVVWSLLLPAFDYAGSQPKGIFVVSVGFFLGCALMLILDKTLPHQHCSASEPEGGTTGLPRQILLVLAVALHNIPEGLALGVVLCAAMQPGYMSIAMAFSFALGLALQNLPEGLAVVLPLKNTGMEKRKILQWGLLSSFAEPLAALIGMYLSYSLSLGNILLMPILLGCAAGAMTFIIVEELIPESQQDSGSGHLPTYGFLLGFWVMAMMGAFAS